MTDWRLVLWRLRPTSAYHWLGDGMNDTYASIGEWRDPETIKPTEQECLDEWDIYLVEKAALDAEEAATEANQADAEARFLLSQLANKTPQEIYTLMQARMDSWSNLGQAKADLREWLPLLSAIIAWKVI